MFHTYANEGRQGEHTFFTASLRWGELDQALVFHDELPELDVDHQMQRGLSKGRLDPLRDYLLEEQDHFFSALTLIILPRDLNRPAVEAEGSDDETDWDYWFRRLPKEQPGQQRPGLLYLSGDVRLFPADGQHRAKSGRMALKDDPDLAREEVPVVLVPYRDADQVRQLFSDLNLNAKPISKTMGYDFEKRDPVALAAKTIGRKVPLFSGRVNRINNSLPKSSSNVITLNTLVQGTRLLAIGLKTFQENGVTVEDFLRDHDNVQAVAEAFQAIVDAFGDYWKVVLDGEPGAAGHLREEYLFPHGLGWVALAMAAAKLMVDHGGIWADAFASAVKSFNWQRSASEWTGQAVIYNEETGVYRVNNTAPAIKSLADKITAAA